MYFDDIKYLIIDDANEIEFDTNFMNKKITINITNKITVPYTPRNLII